MEITVKEFIDIMSKARLAGFQEAKSRVNHIFCSHEWDSDGFSEEGMTIDDYVDQMKLEDK
jgi:hypothetical protein